MKKSFTLVLSLILILTMLAGCGTSTPKVTTSDGSVATDGKTDVTTPDDSVATDVTTAATDELFIWEGTIITDLTEKGETVDELIIPDTATGIGFNACFSADMTKLTIGANVETIDKMAFNMCKHLEELTIPPSVKTIGDSAFYLCNGLVKVTFAENGNLTTIGKDAFLYANSPSFNGTLTLPEGIKTIGESAFTMCYIYDSYLPASVENIPMKAFMLSDYDAIIHVKEGSWADIHFEEFVPKDPFDDTKLRYEKAYY